MKKVKEGKPIKDQRGSDRVRYRSLTNKNMFENFKGPTWQKIGFTYNMNFLKNYGKF